ncbi:MAG: hypothetical protein H6R01_1757 [Burkholderiaceae bacterium]|nr:hypothetical protein [Burkholderiaceae bacterium]
MLPSLSFGQNIENLVGMFWGRRGSSGCKNNKSAFRRQNIVKFRFTAMPAVADMHRDCALQVKSIHHAYSHQ